MVVEMTHGDVLQPVQGNVSGVEIERMDAFGNVFMSSDQSIARSEKGVYTVSDRIAHCSRRRRS